MDRFEIAGDVWGTRLGFSPAKGHRLLMTVRHQDTGGHSSVTLERAYLRPLAAWFAGEAEQGITGDGAGSRLHVANDEAAGIWNPRAGARLRCRLPFGTAVVTIGPLGVDFGWAVMLSPKARQDVAAWLRRVDAESWPELPVR